MDHKSKTETPADPSPGQPAGQDGVQLLQAVDLRELLKVLCNALSDFVVLHGLDTSIIWASPSVYQALGYSVEEFVGHKVLEFLHPEDAMGPGLKALRDFLPSHGRVYLPNRIRKKSGEYLWVETVTSPVRDNQGRIVQMMAVSRDLSQRVKADRALRKSERLYRSTFEAAPLCICHLLPNRRLAWANKRLGSLLHFDPEMAVGGDFADYLHPQDRELLDVLDRLMDGSLDQYKLEIRLVDSQGGTVWVEQSAVALRNQNGALEYVILMMQEISDRKLAEQKLLDACQGLERRASGRTRQLKALEKALEAEKHLRSHAEAALAASEERWRLLAESAPNGIWLLNQEGRIIFSNRIACNFLKYSPEEIAGLSLCDLASEQQAGLLESLLADTLQQMASRCRARLRQKNGDTVAAALSTSAFKAPGGYKVFVAIRPATGKPPDQGPERPDS